MNNLASGGIIEGPDDRPSIITRGCDLVIPKDHPIFEQARRYLDAMVAESTTPCPYCTQPEGWDACPIHRDGTPSQ